MESLKFRSGPRQINHTFSVEFELSNRGLGCVWSPRMPNRKESLQTLNKYREARDDFLREISASTGLNFICAEVPR